MANPHGDREEPTPKLVSADDDDDYVDPEIDALGRYLGFEGLPGMGYCPDFYILLRACDRLHCKPWELLEQSIYWQDVALKAISGEREGQKIKAQRGVI